MVQGLFYDMMKRKILFVCIHNSARSQMAEAFVNFLAPHHFAAQSAGLKPGVLNPLVVEVMKEIGIDISGNQTKDVQHMLARGEHFDFVITVCDESSAEQCPSFPGGAKKIHWNFTDPSAFSGSREEKLQKTREVRDQIRRKIEGWIKEV